MKISFQDFEKLFKQKRIAKNGRIEYPVAGRRWLYRHSMNLGYFLSLNPKLNDNVQEFTNNDEFSIKGKTLCVKTGTCRYSFKLQSPIVVRKAMGSGYHVYKGNQILALCTSRRLAREFQEMLLTKTI